MKVFAWWVGVCLTLCVVYVRDARADTAIVGGDVYTMDAPEPLRGATVLVVDGVVKAVGANLEVPAGYEVVDATGSVVTPGLVAALTHLGLDEIELEASTVDAQLALGFAGPAFDVQYAVNPASSLFPVSRAEGVLHGVVAPRPGADPIAGLGAAISLTASEPVLEPQVGLFGAVDENVATFVGGSRSEVVARIRRALIDTKRFSPTRWRFEQGGYTRHDMAVLKRAAQGAIPLILNINRANEIRQALRLADEFGLRLVIVGGAEAWLVADELAAANVPVITDALANLPISFSTLNARLDNAALLNRAGVNVAFSHVESHNIRTIRQLAGNAVAHGMPWFAALRAITRTPAEIYGLNDGIGRIVVNQPANLVVWTGDPLEVTTWAKRVMAGGQWVSPQTRQTKLLERYRDLSGQAPFGHR